MRARVYTYIHTYIYNPIQALKEHELLAKAEATAMREEVDKLTEMLREATEKLKVHQKLCAHVHFYYISWYLNRIWVS